MATSKNAGGRSQQQNDFLMPMTPESVSATNVGTDRPFNNGAATVSFSLPAGSYAATSYTATSSPGGYTGTGASSPIIVTGLQSNTSYTFTVVAFNEYGNSSESAASSSITITTVPDAPAAPTASTPTPSSGVNVAGSTTDTVVWAAPTYNGGLAVSNYEWASSDSKTGQTASTSASVSQEGATSQTYQVRAYNANGWSAFSAASNSITTFSFSPFSVFGFSPAPPFTVFGFSPAPPFTVFGFSPAPPFTVFGFSPAPPFTVFGFSPTPPFSVFGFSPFSVFGFSPFKVFGFSPVSFKVFGFSPVFVVKPEDEEEEI